MNRRMLLMLSLTLIVLLSSVSRSQAEMRRVFPKHFSLTGSLELRYVDYFLSIPNGGDHEYERSFLEQRYRIGAQGYIYHPRLAVFSAGVTYTDIKQIKTVVGRENNSHNIGYDLNATFLPYRPISMDVYARHTLYAMDHWNLGDEEVTANYYGVRIRTRNFLGLPTIRLEYTHRDQGLFGYRGTNSFNGDSRSSTGRTSIESDEYTLDIRGGMKLLTTRYLFFLQYADFSGPSLSYTQKYVRLNLRSRLREGVYLQNLFSYSDVDFSKLIALTSQMDIDHHERYRQFYSYSFYKTEQEYAGLPAQGIASKKIEEKIHSMTGSWTYRFPFRVHTSLSLNYGLRDNDEEVKFYGIGFGISYSKPFLGFNVSPKYRFLFRKDEEKGKLLENTFDVDLITRKIKWGTVYLNHSLIFSKERSISRYKLQDEFGFPGEDVEYEERVTDVDSIINSLRTGIRGRGPSKRLTRARWNLEFEAFLSKAEIERTKKESSFSLEEDTGGDKESYTREISRYSVFGNVSYPVGWASVFFSTGYSFGESNSVNLQRFFFEERVNYPVLKNLYLSVKWKDIWKKIEDSPTEHVREYTLSSEYHIGKTTLSLDGAILRSKAGSGSRDIYVRRLYLKLRRYI